MRVSLIFTEFIKLVVGLIERKTKTKQNTEII